MISAYDFEMKQIISMTALYIKIYNYEVQDTEKYQMVQLYAFGKSQTLQIILNWKMRWRGSGILGL